MGVIDILTRLDTRVLPRLARGLGRVRRVVGHRRIRPLPAAALVLVLAVLATAVSRVDKAAPESPGSGSKIRVGVSNGDLIADYIGQSRAELDRLAKQDQLVQTRRRIYALVSLATYLSPEGLAKLIPAATEELEPVAAYARVPLHRRQTELMRLAAQRLPGDVVADMVEVAERKGRDAATYAALADAEAGRQLRALYESNAALARAEASAYRTGCECVYALVVRATAGALVLLGGDKEVRVVDAAPEVTYLARAYFVAPLPEHVDRVEPPPDDAMFSDPSATP